MLSSCQFGTLIWEASSWSSYNYNLCYSDIFKSFGNLRLGMMSHVPICPMLPWWLRSVITSRWLLMGLKQLSHALLHQEAGWSAHWWYNMDQWIWDFIQHWEKPSICNSTPLSLECRSACVLDRLQGTLYGYDISLDLLPNMSHHTAYTSLMTHHAQILLPEARIFFTLTHITVTGAMV